MNKKSHRIIYTTAAIALGIIIVMILSLLGNKSRGPLEEIAEVAGTTLNNIERYFIVNQKKDKREDKLKWFKSDLLNLKKTDIILLGAYDNQTTDSYESIINLEESLHTTFPLIHIYKAWGSKDNEQFPNLDVQAILELGSIPVITWEPWLTDFDANKYPNLRSIETRDKSGLADIAKGIYDFYIRSWALSAAKINKPIFIRFAHEMNDPYRYPWGPHNNSAKDFISAWRHVYKIFKEEGADNIIWIWSPHPAYGFYNDFYPGNDYVDYVGSSALNYGTVANWSKWWSFKDIFEKHYKELALFNKPIMLCEFGSLAVGGSRSKWFSEALTNLPQEYPAMKSILFFHYSDDKTTTQQYLDWYFKNDSSSVKAIINQIKLWPDSVKLKLK